MGHHKEHAPNQQDFKVGKDNVAKSASDSEFKDIRSKQETLLARLSELKAASADAWGELKHGAEGALDELKGSVQKVIVRFEEALKKEKSQETKA